MTCPFCQDSREITRPTGETEECPHCAVAEDLSEEGPPPALVRAREREQAAIDARFYGWLP